MNQRYHAPAIAALALLIAAGEAGAQAGYTITDLGALRGSPMSRACGISEHGVVVGWSLLGGKTRPVQFTSSGPIDLGTVVGQEGMALAVNSSGLIVGYHRNLSGSVDRSPFEATSPGNVTDLGGELVSLEAALQSELDSER